MTTPSESQNTEFKTSWHDDYLKWICGFANACFLGGYIDTWGRGTLKIIQSCKDSGLPEPEIREMNGGVEVTLFTGTESGMIKDEHKGSDQRHENVDRSTSESNDEKFGMISERKLQGPLSLF